MKTVYNDDRVKETKNHKVKSITNLKKKLCLLWLCIAVTKYYMQIEINNSLYKTSHLMLFINIAIQTEYSLFSQDMNF